MKALPMVCCYDHPDDGRLVFIRRGTPGFWERDFMGVVDDDMDADKWNTAHGINKGEAEAMFSGSMFGWDVKAARASSWTEDGKFIYRPLDD